MAKNGRLIWSTEQISGWGYISEKLPDREIPPYRWMGHLWYYPQHQKVFNKLSEKEKEEVRKQATGIKKNLRKVINGLAPSATFRLQ